MRRLFLFCVCALSISVPLTASSVEPLVAGDEPRYGLGGHLEMIRNPAHGMSLAEAMAGSWNYTPAAEPNGPGTLVESWVRFRVTAQTDHALVLVFNTNNVNYVDLFVLHADGRQEHFESGDRVPFQQRSLPNRYPLFPLNLQHGETAWCYVELRNEQGLVFPLAVWDRRAFFATDQNEQLVMGFLVGIFLFVALFNTLIFIATGERAYLFYVLFVLTYLLFELGIRDIGGQYLWPRNSWLDDPVMLCSAAAAIVFGLLFTREFLQTKTWAPVMHKIMNVVLAVALVNVICTFIFPLSVMVLITNGLLLVAAVTFLPNAVVVLRRGYRAARFYLAAWSCLLVGGVIYGLLNFALVPNTVLTANAMTFGATVQVILLSFAVVDRMLVLRRDREIMARAEAEAIEKRLYIDSLTELPNRTRLLEDLEKQKKPVTVALVNIDHFKEINDLFGQKAGDSVIRELGRRVQVIAHARGGSVYRLHADEFAVVIPRETSDEGLEQLGTDLSLGSYGEPYRHENEPLRLEVSVGIAVCAERHLEKADMALSVSRPRKRFTVYKPQLQVTKQYADNLHWLHIIRESIDADRVVPVFQPILDNRTGAIEKYESLMRLQTLDGSLVPPSKFLTIAKKSKIYPDLSRAIIQKVASRMVGRRGEVSINVALEDILNPDVRAQIRRVMQTGDVGHRIMFEILESEGIENYDDVSGFIDEVKAGGAKIAIDDFGSGYSNFDHILRLGVDYLKLDASLIKNVDTQEYARCIVETIVSFARRLGILTVAEFVHSAAVQDAVRDIGVDFSQGFFIAEPSPEMFITGE